MVAVAAANHVVPQCAMRVRRTKEMGPLQPYQPTDPCGCYFDKLAAGTTSCETCAQPADCPATAPVCSYGYCEKK
jgi:hypothetical protein